MSKNNDPTPRSQRPRPYERIVFATDFSAGAAQAIGRVGRLPLVDGASVSVVHVLSDRLPASMRASAELTARRQLEQAATAVLESTAELGRRDIEVSTELCRGQAYVEILRHAKAARADVIVLGRHGRRPVREMFIGSTADRVIRAGDLPVLVVRHKATRSYRRPVIAVDLEATCRSVVTAALRALGPEVNVANVVHVYQVPFEGFLMPTVSPEELTELRKEYKQTAASNLRKVLSSLGDLGIRWQTAIMRGDPRKTILAEATRRRADLLAVGTHGRSGLSHALLGSVAEWVIQAAACDVLVARSNHASP